MEQTTTGVAAQKSPFRPRAAAATVADIMRPPLTTVGLHDHVAAAAYLMKHAGTTALLVLDAQTGQPAGLITETDIDHVIADGKDVNNVRVNAAITTRPAIITTTSIRDAAKIMTARHYRHLPVTSDDGLLGVIDITDVCRALNGADQDDRNPAAGLGRAARPASRAHHRRPASARPRALPRPETWHDPKPHPRHAGQTPAPPAPPQSLSRHQLLHLTARLIRSRSPATKPVPAVRRPTGQAVPEARPHAWH
jgi:CBS domain-containing protein